MASVFIDRKGNPVIQFVATDGRRRSISLAGEKKRAVEIIKHHVEELVAAQKAARSPYDETNEWLARIGAQLHKKLARAGLVPNRQDTESVKLAVFLDRQLSKLTGIKPSTMIGLRQCRNDLVEFFGANKPLDEITEGGAEDWRQFLRTRPAKHGRQKSATAQASQASLRDRGKPKKPPRKLQENTVRRRCGRARQLLEAAVRHRLIERNPFAGMKGVSVLPNRKRYHFIGRVDADKVIEACPDAQWKLIFALARYGGLRCPSELLVLRWGDVNWDGSRILVHSPKTEHLEGKEERTIPLFPELRPYLQAALDELLADFDPKKTRLSEQPVISKFRDPNCNLRTQMVRIIRRAGLKPWPKLFQDLSPLVKPVASTILDLVDAPREYDHHDSHGNHQYVEHEAGPGAEESIETGIVDRVHARDNSRK